MRSTSSPVCSSKARDAEEGEKGGDNGLQSVRAGPQRKFSHAAEAKSNTVCPWAYTLMRAQEVEFLRHSPRPGPPRPRDRNDSAGLARTPQRSRSTEQVAKPYRRGWAHVPPQTPLIRGG